MNQRRSRGPRAPRVPAVGSRAEAAASADSQRLHKLLAQHGFGSRREIEKWMLEGRVLLNKAAAQPGDRYKPGDRVSIDGRDISGRLKAFCAAQVILYHKPQGQQFDGQEQTEEVQQGPTVLESLPALRGAHWHAINGMQAGDSGLLVLTTDGRLADALQRRAQSIPTAYMVRVLLPHPLFDITSLPRVVQYDEETVEFESVEPAGGEGTNRWFLVKSSRSRRRAAVRALFDSRDLKVSRVIQVSFGELELPRDLPRGRHRVLTDEQLQKLYDSVELTAPLPPRQAAAPRGSQSRRRPPPDRRGKSRRK